MRLDSSLNIALNEQGCLRYPGPKTGYPHVLGLNKLNRGVSFLSRSQDSTTVGTQLTMFVVSKLNKQISQPLLENH